MQSGKLDEPLRIVIDESSLVFDHVKDIEAEAAIDDFNDALSEVLQAGIPVGKFSLFYDVECRTGLPLYALLYERASDIDADTLRRCSELLDRCLDWDEEVDDVPTACVVREKQVESWSLGYAVMRSADYFMACLGCSVSQRKGLSPVAAGDASVEIFFVVDPSDLIPYWQLVVAREKVGVDHFFAMAHRAFPQLVFHPDLDFRKFEGAYDEVYDWVVRVFAVLNNYLAESFEYRKGVRQLVQGDIASYGIDISPESTQTHKNKKADGQRMVEFDGRLYSCEWHAKRLWNVDRIHFTVPGSLPDGGTLIGRFVKHLDT